MKDTYYSDFRKELTHTALLFQSRKTAPREQDILHEIELTPLSRALIVASAEGAACSLFAGIKEIQALETDDDYIADAFTVSEFDKEGSIISYALSEQEIVSIYTKLWREEQWSGENHDCNGDAGDNCYTMEDWHDFEATMCAYAIALTARVIVSTVIDTLDKTKNES